jgi:hypothetical protein
MNIELPPTIAAFFQAFNAHDTDTLALFSPEMRLYLMKDANITAPTQSKDGLRKPMPPTNHMLTQPTSLIQATRLSSPHKSAAPFRGVRLNSATTLRSRTTRLPH